MEAPKIGPAIMPLHRLISKKKTSFRPERGCFKTGKCRFAAAPAKAGADVGQQVVGIGFSRCVREAQVSGLLKHPPSGCRFRDGFLYQGYAKTEYPWAKFRARLQRAGLLRRERSERGGRSS